MNQLSTHVLDRLPAQIAPRRASNILFWAVGGFVLVFILWASLTKLDRTVHGAGRVVPTAQLQIVSNLEGGIVAQILAKQGDQVRKGTPLVLMDRTSSNAELGAGRTAVDAMGVKVARLQAEINGSTPRFPSSSDPLIAEQVEIERSLYRSRQADLAQLTAAAEARLTQASRAVAEAEASQDAARASLAGARDQARILEPLVASGVEPRLSLIQAQRAEAVAASQLAAAVASTARARSAVAEARASLGQQRQQWRSQAADELTKMQAEYVSRREALPALQDRSARTTVRAPLSGRVNRVLVTTVGGSVKPGEPLVELVPSESGLIVETAVRPSDIAFVRTGQRALVKVSAYDYAIYGGLEGEVVNISPDAIVNERTGESHYLVQVRTRQDHLVDRLGRRLPVSPGMLADVNLVGEKRSIMSYILSPITRLSENAFRE
jgi:membrane fusion protein, adhesin transport system